MIEEFPAKSGDLTATAEGVLLHSRYDPAREAARYLERSLGDTRPATLLLLGTGLGYLIAEARRRFAHSRIIAASAAGACREEFRREADHYVDLGATPPEAAVAAALAPEDVAGLELLEWEPDLRAARGLGERARRAVRETVSRLNADIATTGFFGRRYLRNAVRAALFSAGSRPARRQFTGPGERPICIAASGPSLERAADWIRRNRSAVELWALSSAAAALEARGLHPDLLVHQDAGFHATLHLRESTAAVLMPITAAAPPAGGNRRRETLLFDQSSRIERDVFAALGVRPPSTAETGTVAATATALALALSGGPVYLAGLDLCRDDIRAHARPHAFEPLLHARATRLSPYHSQLAADAFDRSTAAAGDARIREERGLGTYAAWFRSLPRTLAVRLRRVEPSPVDIGVEAGGEDEPAPARGGRHEQPAFELPPFELPPPAERAEALLRVTAAWRQAVGRVLDGEEATGDGEIAYLVSAPDYVAAVAASRRGDREAEREARHGLATRAHALFDRLELVSRTVAARGGRG